MSDAELNALVLELQGSKCLMPDCDDPWQEKAHCEPSGMGGRPSTKTPENLVGLCKHHHDVFDGRDLHGRQRMLRLLMRSLADSVRRRRIESDPSLLHDEVAG